MWNNAFEGLNFTGKSEASRAVDHCWFEKFQNWDPSSQEPVLKRNIKRAPAPLRYPCLTLRSLTSVTLLQHHNYLPAQQDFDRPPYHTAGRTTFALLSYFTQPCVLHHALDSWGLLEVIWKAVTAQPKPLRSHFWTPCPQAKEAKQVASEIVV